jgi:hypothetical protein
LLIANSASHRTKALLPATFVFHRKKHILYALKQKAKTKDDIKENSGSHFYPELFMAFLERAKCIYITIHY